MLNFELYNPVNYVFGKGQTEKLATLVPKDAKILLAYGGGSIFKNGVHETVTAALKGFEIVEFGGIDATSIARTSCPSAAKSALRIDGAIRTGAGVQS